MSAIISLSTALTTAIGILGCIDLPRELIGGEPEGNPFKPGEVGEVDVRFKLDIREDVHPISPYIYGFNDVVSTSLNRPVSVHFGHNRVSAYNWETDDSNAGSDWYNQNDDTLIKTVLAKSPGAALRAQLNADVLLKVIAIPINDYVAADHDDSEGDVINSGDDYLETRFRQNMSKKETPLSPEPDLNDDYVYQDEFVNWLLNNNPGGDVAVALDNDPDRWDLSHPRIRVAPLTLDELVERNTEYASVIKDRWPPVEVTGFAGSSWYGMATLWDETIEKDDTLVLHQYLKRMNTAGKEAGHDLIDYLEFHYIPEEINGKRLEDASLDSELLAAERMQAPRALWDPTYIAPGEVTGAWLGDEGLAYIPRVKQAIDEYYPELKMMLSVWNFGAPDHISGAVAMADTLGILGREGVDAAMNFDYFDPSIDREYLNAGFRIYRNFAGDKGEFGDMSFRATTDDIERTSVYGSYDEANPERMVIVAINKASELLTAGITIANEFSYSSLEVYVLDENTPAIQPGVSIDRIEMNAFIYEMPPRSVTVLLPQR